MYTNISSGQIFDGLRLPVPVIYPFFDGSFQMSQISKEVIMSNIHTQKFPKRLNRIHIRRILGQKEKFKPFMTGQKLSNSPSLVPPGIIQHHNQFLARITFQEQAQESHKMNRIDCAGQVTINPTANRVHSSKDMRLAVLSGPCRYFHLLPAQSPCSAERGRQLDGNLVGKKQVQAFEISGATQQNFQTSFFLARSRGSCPGNLRLGRNSRQPIL